MSHHAVQTSAQNLWPLRLIGLLLWWCAGTMLYGQSGYLLRDAGTGKTTYRKDSLSAVKFLDSLALGRYPMTSVVASSRQADRILVEYDTGIDAGKTWASYEGEEIKTANLDSLKKAILQKAGEQGYAFSRIRTEYIGQREGLPKVKLTLEKGGERRITGLVLKNVQKVPRRFVRNLERQYAGSLYNSKTVTNLQNQLSGHPYLALERPPQTLFTKDSTNIYLFLQKKKVNIFDGMVGFGNDKSDKVTFNGTLNLQFKNIFNGFESIGLYWQRNPDKGQTFQLNTDVPYLFNTNVGAAFDMHIFRQDSTFADVKIQPSLYYQLDNLQKIGVRGYFETSAVVGEETAGQAGFSKKGGGLSYEFLRPSELALLVYRTRIAAAADLLSMQRDGAEREKQYRYFLLAEHNINLRGSHYLSIKAESAMLSGRNAFLQNELLRFGGWNSMRGFNENTLLADFYAFGGAEYRYLITEQSFFDVFAQYGQLNNKVLDVRPQLYSFGIGFNFILPIGLMSFQISNGNTSGNAFRINATKIHWGIVTRF